MHQVPTCESSREQEKLITFVELHWKNNSTWCKSKLLSFQSSFKETWKLSDAATGKLLSNLCRVGDRVKNFHKILHIVRYDAIIRWTQVSSTFFYHLGVPDLNYGWTWYLLFHSLFSQVCIFSIKLADGKFFFFSQVLHTISISLTVTLAVWRYIAIK